jgi:hypothetical protein
MAALHPALVRVLECMKRTFDRPGSGLRTYDYDVDDRMFLRGSGSFKFSGSPTEPRQGFVRVVGDKFYYRVEVCADSMSPPLKESFAIKWLRSQGMVRRDVRSPKVRKFAAYALSRVHMHFKQVIVDEVHEL